MNAGGRLLSPLGKTVGISANGPSLVDGSMDSFLDVCTIEIDRRLDIRELVTGKKFYQQMDLEEYSATSSRITQDIPLDRVLQANQSPKRSCRE